MQSRRAWLLSRAFSRAELQRCSSKNCARVLIVTTASQQEIRAVLRISEEKFKSQILELAQYCGWKRAHFRPAQKKDGTWYTPVEGDGKGFPDLVLVHRRRRLCLWVELKSDTGKVSAEQLDWINCLMDAGQRVAVWRPHMWDMIELLLKGERE